MGVGGGGKGGEVSAAPMLEYGDKALKLQKDQLDYSKQVSQPWLGAGTSAVNQLSNLLGLGSTSPTVNNTSLRGGIMGQLYSTNEKEQGKGIYYNPTTGASNTLGGQGFYDTGVKVTSGDTGNEQSVLDTAVSKVNSALPQYTPDANTGKLLETYTGQDIYTDPSYDYRLAQGTKAAERQLAASGKYLTPAASQALMDVGQQMGSQEYQNAYNRFNQDQGNLYNRLAGLAGMGQQQTGQVIGSGQNYANQAGELYTGMGNAITSAQIANAQNKGSMFGSLLNAGATLGGAYLSGGASLGAGAAGSGWTNANGLTYFTG